MDCDGTQTSDLSQQKRRKRNERGKWKWKSIYSIKFKNYNEFWNMLVNITGLSMQEIRGDVGLNFNMTIAASS